MNRQGLTLVEVIMALAIIGVLVGVFATSLSSNLGVTANTNQRSQSSQILGQLSRKIIDNDPLVLTNPGTDLTWGYAQLGALFPNLATQAGSSDINKYRAEISIVGNATVGVTSLAVYQITLCFQAENEVCQDVTTFGLTAVQNQTDAAIPGLL